jgi:hypothetical protein
MVNYEEEEEEEEEEESDEGLGLNISHRTFAVLYACTACGVWAT